MTYNSQFTVRGQAVRIINRRVLRRYAVVEVRAEPVHTEHGVYVAFAELLEVSDSLASAREAVKQYEPYQGSTAVVIDMQTEKEVVCGYGHVGCTSAHRASGCVLETA